MSECTRRSFVKGGALALVALGAAPRFLVRTALAQEWAGRPKVLIASFQRGAVDVLSMVAPHRDPDAYPLLANLPFPPPTPVHPHTTLHLSSSFCLSPPL